MTPHKYTLRLHRYPLIIALIGALLLPAACSLLPGEAVTPQPTAAGTQTAAVLPTPTTAPPPTAAPTATSEPTPIRPLVRVSDQTVDEDGVLLIDEVALPDSGWLAVFSATADGPGELLGYVDLPAGLHRDVRVTIDPFQATDTLIAQLHREGGDPQELELPEPDGLMAEDAQTAFDITLTLPQATITVADQSISRDGVVTVGQVQLLEPTWVAIHADVAGAAGAVLGQRLLEPGEHTDVTIPIRWQAGTPQLQAILHEDSGETGYFDYPGDDPPLLAGGTAIGATFAVTYPPDVVVFDQPVIDGQIVIDRVISNGPGWVVVHRDEDGQPGLIIGHAALADGLNEGVAVELIEAALTPLLYTRLHEDTAPGDAFNFPEADPPVLEDGRLPQAQRIRTDAGSYIIIHDQSPAADGSVIATMVMATSDAWLVIQADEDGTPGAVLGQIWVPRGMNRDVIVAIDPQPDAGIVHAVLVQDAGEVELFEYPGGPDTPFRVQGGTVAVPFRLSPLTPQP
jgi:hypothetical protein